MPARVPAPLLPKLDAYLQLLDELAPGLVTGCYLTGSLALDAFDERSSDVDFVAVLGETAAPAAVAALCKVHAAVEQSEPRWPLEGDYLQPQDLGRLTPHIPPHPVCANGVFHAAGCHDLNPVTWSLLKRHGIALRGPAPAALPFTTEWAQVAEYMRDNLNTYWRSFTRPSRRLFWLLTDWGVEWAVLGVCRPWLALRTGAIPSKVQGGEAMLDACPPQMCKIVAEGLALRRGERSRYRSRWGRGAATAAFVRYTVSECNKMAN